MADIQQQLAARAQAQHGEPAPARVGDVIRRGDPIPGNVTDLGDWRLTEAGHWHLSTAQVTCRHGECGGDGVWLMKVYARLVVTGIRDLQQQGRLSPGSTVRTDSDLTGVTAITSNRNAMPGDDASVWERDGAGWRGRLSNRTNSLGWLLAAEPRLWVLEVEPERRTYAGLPVRTGMNFDDPQRAAEDLMAFQDAVQEALRTEEAGHVLGAIECLQELRAEDRWHRAVLRRHMAEHGLEDPTWKHLSEEEKAVLRAADDKVLAASPRRLPTGRGVA